MDAIENGHLRIVELLIENALKFNNIDVNVKNKCGTTIWHDAIFNGHEKIVELLIENSVKLNVDLNAKCKQGKTGFHYACYACSLGRDSNE